MAACLRVALYLKTCLRDWHYSQRLVRQPQTVRSRIYSRTTNQVLCHCRIEEPDRVSLMLVRGAIGRRHTDIARIIAERKSLKAVIEPVHGYRCAGSYADDRFVRSLDLPNGVVKEVERNLNI